MILVQPIQYPNHRTAKTSQSSGFLVFPKNWTYSLLYLSELVSSSSYKAAIEEITADTVPYLVYSDSYRAEDPSEVSEPLLARWVPTRKEKPESDFSYCSK